MDNLTAKQANFIKYLQANPDATYREAYLFAYDVTTDNLKTIDNSIQKLINTPSIAGVIKEIQKEVKEDLKYTALDSFNELEEIKQMMLDSDKKDGNYNNIIKCAELKGKLAGLYVDKKEHAGADGGAIQLNVITNYADVDDEEE